MERIDIFIDSLNHPFIAVLLGLVLWFLIKWSWFRDNNINKSFFDDQKDEIAVSVIGGLIFLIFDDEIIVGYHDLMKDGSTQTELKFYYYLIVGPAIERVYKVKQIYTFGKSFVLKNLKKAIDEELDEKKKK